MGVYSDTKAYFWVVRGEQMVVVGYVTYFCYLIKHSTDSVTLIAVSMLLSKLHIKKPLFYTNAPYQKIMGEALVLSFPGNALKNTCETPVE